MLSQLSQPVGCCTSQQLWSKTLNQTHPFSLPQFPPVSLPQFPWFYDKRGSLPFKVLTLMHRSPSATTRALRPVTWHYPTFCFSENEHNSSGTNAPQSPPPRKSLVHPLDQHKLLYILHFDSQLTLYAFNTLQSILSRAPHQFVCASSATSISSSSTPHQEKIKELLIRHRRSLLGKGFYGALYERVVSPTGGFLCEVRKEIFCTT